MVDVGCGTGTFACELAGRGLTVTGVDAAAASLSVARSKPRAGHLRHWVGGGPNHVRLHAVLPGPGADLEGPEGGVVPVGRGPGRP
ncbi:MAG: class I SAM-dependent methyltransferase [Candidatus Dormibacteria bacterium]